VWLVLAVASAAGARNLITEWGLHDPNDYDIRRDLQGNDVEVRIKANTQPELVWKFQAWNDVNGAGWRGVANNE
jgi:hypothetical protein